MKKSAPHDRFIPDPPGPDDDRFARAFKNWREWNTVVNFLTNLHFGVDESKVFCLESDPPDVIFCDAQFEVKEILDPGRRRHDEAKAARAYAESNGGGGRTAYYSPKDLTPKNVGDLVLQELSRIAQSYTDDLRRNMDLLFYVNKLEHWFENGDMPDPTLFASYGWRSVSAIVATQDSLIFHSRPEAASFLTENVGRVRHRWESLDGDTPYG